MTMRTGIDISWIAREEHMVPRTRPSTAGNASPVWMSWVYQRWKGTSYSTVSTFNMFICTERACGRLWIGSLFGYRTVGGGECHLSYLFT